MASSSNMVGDLNMSNSKAHVGNNYMYIERVGALDTRNATRRVNIAEFFHSLLATASPFASMVLPAPALQADELRPGALVEHFDYEKNFKIEGQNIKDGTCVWILNHALYRWWLGERGYAVMWMTGSPGLGKTCLAIQIVRMLKEQLPQKIRKSCLVLYSLSKNRDNRTLSRVLCVVLHQLLEAVHDSIARANLKRINLWSSRNGGAPAWEAPSNLLWQCFCEAVQASNLKKVFVILDGLDDCAFNDHVELFQMMRTGPTNLSILVVSQMLEQVRIEVSKFLANKAYYKYLDLDEEQAAVNADMDVVIDMEVDRVAMLRGYTAGQKQIAIDKLKTNKRGLFLPMTLVVGQLELTETKHLTTVLEYTSQHLPELDDLYEKLLSAVPTATAWKKSDVPKYVLYAFRTLTVSELGLVCGYKSAAADLEDRSTLTMLPFRDLRSDLRLLGPIMKITQEDDTVDFIHPSARRFLEQRANAPALSIASYIVPTETAHLELALLCVNILINHSLEAFPYTHEDLYSTTLRDIMEKHVLLEYAFQYWDLHIKEAFNALPSLPPHPARREQARSGLFDSLRELVNTINDSTRARFAAYFASYKRGKYSTYFSKCSLSLLYIHLGLSTLLREQLLIDPIFNGDSHDSDTHVSAVYAAAAGGDHKTFQVLRDAINVDLTHSDFDNLLQVAARYGNAEIVRLVLAERIKLGLAKEVAKTALFAAERQNDEVLDVLNENPAVLRAAGEMGRNILHELALAATDNGKSEPDAVLRAILHFKRRGIGLNEADAYGRTLLHYVCWSNSLCSKPLLENLLQEHADPWAVDQFGELPLHLAARKANYEAFEMLMTATDPSETKLNVGRQLPYDNKNNSDVSQLSPELETRTAEARFRSKGGLTPLHWAMSRHYETAYGNDVLVLRALLIRGFSLTAPTRMTGRTPISIASENPIMANLLYTVYYRLDGADHMALSMTNVLGVFEEATCVDDLWTGLRFEPMFETLMFYSKKDANSMNDGPMSTQRTLLLFFILGRTILAKLLPQLDIPHEVAVGFVEQLHNHGPFNFQDPMFLKWRQSSMLTELCSWEIRRESSKIASLRKTVEQARRRRLFSILPENAQASSNATGSADGQKMQYSIDYVTSKTVRKWEMRLLKYDWERFLWNIFRASTLSGDELEWTSGAIKGYGFEDTFSKNVGAESREDQVELLRRLTRVL